MVRIRIPPAQLIQNKKFQILVTWKASELQDSRREAFKEGMQLYINTFFLPNLDANLALLNSDKDALDK